MGPDRRNTYAHPLAWTIRYTSSNTDADGHANPDHHSGTDSDARTDRDAGTDGDTLTHGNPDSFPDRDTDLLRK